jgi:hypothetical protein
MSRGRIWYRYWSRASFRTGKSVRVAGCCSLFEHLMAYKKTEDAKRMEALNELTRQAQELNLGY